MRASNFLLPLVCVFMLAGPSTSDGQESAPPKKMIKYLEKTLKCDWEKMQWNHLGSDLIHPITYTTWALTGCGDEFYATWWTASGGYRGIMDDKSLRKKAPFDLGCEKDKITYTYIDYATEGVEGCGKRATYMQSSAGWVANVTSEGNPE